MKSNFIRGKKIAQHGSRSIGYMMIIVKTMGQLITIEQEKNLGKSIAQQVASLNQKYQRKFRFETSDVRMRSQSQE